MNGVPWVCCPCWYGELDICNNPRPHTIVTTLPVQLPLLVWCHLYPPCRGIVNHVMV